MLSKEDIDKVKKAGSICACGHIGDKINSEHDGTYGHGYCLSRTCMCQKFTWKRFVYEPDSNKQETSSN